MDIFTLVYAGALIAGGVWLLCWIPRHAERQALRDRAHRVAATRPADGRLLVFAHWLGGCFRGLWECFLMLIAAVAYVFGLGIFCMLLFHPLFLLGLLLLCAILSALKD